MGKQLMAFYDFVDSEKGLLGKIELATRTKIPSTRAMMVPDSPERIAQFIEAIVAICGKKPPLEPSNE